MSKQNQKKFHSLNQAISAIESQKEGIPFEAIKYLYNQPPSKKLLDKIIFALKHAYDDTYYNEEEDFCYCTPLWYAVVAEQYICQELIEPVVSLFTTTYDDWDFLNEQGEYLVGKLAAKYPDLMLEKVVEAINKLVKEKSELAYLFLFDAFYYADADKYKDWFLTTLKDDGLYWKDMFAHHVARLQIKEALPVIEELLKKEEGGHSEIEFAEALEQLETGASKYPDADRPFCQTRSGWEKHYAAAERCFYDDADDDDEPEYFKEEPQTWHPPVIIKKADKVGRNEPCPCGSGKKYKKCCLVKDEAVDFQAAGYKKTWDSVNVKLMEFFKSQDVEEELQYAETEYYCYDLFEDDFEDDGKPPQFADLSHFYNWFAYDYRWEDGNRLIDRFIAQTGDSLTPREKEAAQILSDSYTSLYEITGIVKNVGLEVAELFSGKKFFVHDKTATKMATKWLVLSARMIALGDRSYFSDIGPVFPPRDGQTISEHVSKNLKKIARKVKKKNLSLQEFLKEEGVCFFNGYFLRMHYANREMFFENLTTTEGDKFIFVTAYYDVLDFASARAGLKTFPDLRGFPKDTANELQAVWIVDTPDGPMDNVVYGDITLTKKQLTLECKSQERLKLGKELLTKCLGASIKHRADKIQDAGQLLKEEHSKPKKVVKPDELPKDIQHQLVGQFMEEHFCKWVDQKIPALDGKTPREAAKGIDSREKLIQLLKDIEYSEEQKRLAGEYWYDVNKIRRELGL